MEEYKHLIMLIGSVLKSEGFKKKGDTFYLLDSGNTGLIDFQKSRGSSKEVIKFTINLGVQSTNIVRTLRNRSSDKVSIEDCHWKKRIGHLLSDKQDLWWNIGSDRNVTIKVANEISFILKEKALPDLKSHISDESLKEKWLAGLCEGATELQCYIYLTTLLKITNDNRLPKIIENFRQFSRGKSYEITAIEHLKDLGIHIN